MKRAALFATAALLLSATAAPAPPQVATPSWTKVVRGVLIRFHFVAPGALNGAGGQAYFLNGVCTVELEAGYAYSHPEYAANVVVHEVGHCLDGATGWSHFGWREGDGCFLSGNPANTYYCDPAEGFAEAYAHRARALCGPSLFRFGFVGDPRLTTCAELPDPKSVRPPE